MKSLIIVIFLGLMSTSCLWADCTSPAGVIGQMQYISGSIKICDGSTWNNSISVIGASCSGTTAGTIQFNSGEVSFCNGTNWFSMKGTFLGSCSGMTAGTVNWSGGIMSMCDGTNLYGMIATDAPPTNLSITHYSNYSYFYFSWTGGYGNGGTGGCKIQFLKNGTTWTDLALQNCDSNRTNAIVNLPGDGWTNNFNSSGVSVRVIRTSDSVVLGSFSQKLLCYSAGYSTYSTPTYDENCNGYWDDYSSSYNPNYVGGCPSGQICLQGAYYSNPSTCTGTVTNSGGPYCGSGGYCSGSGYGVTSGSGCTYDAGGSYTYYYY